MYKIVVIYKRRTTDFVGTIEKTCVMTIREYAAFLFDVIKLPTSRMSA